MSDRPFLDTTILIYAVTTGDPRCEIAESLLAAGGCVSVQVLNEFAAVARRKLKMPWPEVMQALDAVRALCGPVAAISVETHTAALAIAEQTGYHMYDALIVASALENECTLLYSEDMQHDRVVRGLNIRNPFR